jgi:hypothetical protein
VLSVDGDRLLSIVLLACTPPPSLHNGELVHKMSGSCHPCVLLLSLVSPDACYLVEDIPCAPRSQSVLVVGLNFT